MKAQKTKLLEFIITAPRLEIPVFQRDFCWGIPHLTRLWNDIQNIILKPTQNSYFFGLITHIPRDFNEISSFKTNFIVDGQQRLTAISLFMAALSEHFDAVKLKQNYLYFRADNEFYPKLRLNKEDYNDYSLILKKEDDLLVNSGSLISQAYTFFLESLKSSDLLLNDYLLALDKLEIMEIILEKDKDNPQMYFDSINSTGTVLDNIQQIKSCLLSGLPQIQQTAVYYEYIKPIEESFEIDKDKGLYERFLSHYLSIQNEGKTVESKELYYEFGKFYNDKLKYQQPEEIVKHISKYATYFLRLIKNEFNEELAGYIRRINLLSSEKAYPFLMEVVEDYENKLISEEIFGEILKTIEVFVLNHMKHEADLNSKSFANLSKNISKMLVTKSVSQDSPEASADISEIQESNNKSIKKVLKIRDLSK